MKFNTTHLICLWAIAFVLTACIGDLSPEEQGQLNSQISTEVVGEIRKSFPLPEPAFIINHLGDTVNFKTSLSVEEVVSFYRNAYSQQGLAERADASNVGSDSAELVFDDPAGGKSVHIQITVENNETRVKLEKK